MPGQWFSMHQVVKYFQLATWAFLVSSTSSGPRPWRKRTSIVCTNTVDENLLYKHLSGGV